MSARVLDCPQCGAPVNFRSSITVFAVCEHCRSMIVLRGADAELMGVMAALPPDLSPFQIGTRGHGKATASKSSAAFAWNGNKEAGTNGASCTTAKCTAGSRKRRGCS